MSRQSAMDAGSHCSNYSLGNKTHNHDSALHWQAVLIWCVFILAYIVADSNFTISVNILEKLFYVG